MMAKQPAQNYPGGSKSRVSRAGDAVRRGNPTPDDLNVIDTWRAAHRSVLNSFQALLRNRSRGKKISVVQRHKRKLTIFGKLRRFPKMELARMDDIAGCRLIFRSITELNEFREKLHKAHFRHKRRNATDKYDYIAAPKATGYRGIHDVYEYDVNSVAGAGFKGLFIEIQYRTIVQHAWATTVEVIGVITQNQPKFEEGDKRYQEVMVLASEMLARVHENTHSTLPDWSDDALLQEFLRLDNELHLMESLKALTAADSDDTEKRNMILIFHDGKPLQIKSYRDATVALKELFEIEVENPLADVVLVRADTSEEVREAFQNYFKDASQFIKLMEQACQKLSGVVVINRDTAVRSRKRKASGR